MRKSLRAENRSSTIYPGDPEPGGEVVVVGGNEPWAHATVSGDLQSRGPCNCHSLGGHAQRMLPDDPGEVVDTLEGLVVDLEWAACWIVKARV